MADTVSVTFAMGDRVEKVSGSSWRGRIVGTYSTSLTPEGYAVESETEVGSVQIYPAKALRLTSTQPAPAFPREEEIESEWLGGDWFEKWQDATEKADDELMATLDALRGRVEQTILAALLQGKQP